MIIALFLLVGLASGFLSGLIGIGGGILTVPCLLYLFKFVHIANEDLMQFALGTSIDSVSINTFVSMITHHRLKNTLVNVLPTLTISCGIGSLSGSYLTKFFSSNFLRLLFGFFQITIALALFFQKSNEHDESHQMPRGIKLFSLGFVISLLASILGIGGGVIMIPVMIYFSWYINLHSCRTRSTKHF